MKKSKLWIPVVAIVLSLAVIGGILIAPRLPKEEAAVFPVTMVGYTDYYSGSSESYGMVTTDKVQSLFLSGTQTVTEILVYPGQAVKKGDVLFTYDTTLSAINRVHDFECARRAVEMTAERGIAVGAHFVLGLPGETDEMILEQVERINALPLTTIKFHQLQVFAGTAMAEQYDRDPSAFRFWEVEEYIDLFIEILRRLRPDIVVERFASEAPPRYHYGRNWGLIRNETLLAMFESRLRARKAYQGELF